MKIKLISLAVMLLIAAAVFVPATQVSAASHKVKTEVYGVISDGGPVKNAKVTVVCNNHARTDVTDRKGEYYVKFTGAQCPNGSTVTVTAKSGAKGGVSSATVTADTMHLNVAVVNVSVPELGSVAAISATAAGAAGIVYLVRRRQLGQI